MEQCHMLEFSVSSFPLFHTYRALWNRLQVDYPSLSQSTIGVHKDQRYSFQTSLDRSAPLECIHEVSLVNIQESRKVIHTGMAFVSGVQIEWPRNAYDRSEVGFLWHLSAVKMDRLTFDNINVSETFISLLSQTPRDTVQKTTPVASFWRFQHNYSLSEKHGAWFRSSKQSYEI